MVAAARRPTVVLSSPSPKLPGNACRAYECCHPLGLSTWGKFALVPRSAVAIVDGRRATMEVVHARCCGLDVHKKSVVACVLITQPDGNTERYIRTFKTMTTDLVALSDWLSTLSVSHVALESTGVYWRPVYNVLEHEQHADEANRLQKTLEGANIKLAAVATDVLGLSGRAMFAALLDGEQDPDVLANLARGRLRAKLPELRQALEGRVQPHHLVLI